MDWEVMSMFSKSSVVNFPVLESTWDAASPPEWDSMRSGLMDCHQPLLAL